MFIIICGNCNEPLRLPDEAAGKAVRCLKCKEVIMLPPDPAKISGYSNGFASRDFVEEEK
jgi:LSD1 subclass zinc finger protein